MKRDKYSVKHDDLEGSEQHHRLNNEPGEAGDADHADTGEAPDPAIRKAVDASDADTRLAQALREASPEDDDESPK